MDVNAPESMTPRPRTGPGAEPAGDLAVAEMTVGAAAASVGVSVRTLHHWDRIGLVRPSDRTPAGYRTYSATDIGRVHRVLVYQALGFSLAKIATLLDDPAVDELEQLRRQRDLLDERIAGLRRMADAVDGILAARASGTTLTAHEQAELFGRGWREDWADEARVRWGASEQWAQFEENAAVLSAERRAELHRNGEAVYAALAAAKRSSVEPGSLQADELAEQHRAMIGRLFDCSPSMHVCLARLYDDDPRFSARLDDLEPGLSGWLTAVVDAAARARGIDPDAAGWE